MEPPKFNRFLGILQVRPSTIPGPGRSSPSSQIKRILVFSLLLHAVIATYVGSMIVYRRLPSDDSDSNSRTMMWYFDTLDCFARGGEAWSQWNDWFQDEIAGHQSADGSWTPTGSVEDLPGPEQDSGRVGACYRTELCTLMLETYYRFEPGREKPRAVAAAGAPAWRPAGL